MRTSYDFLFSKILKRGVKVKGWTKTDLQEKQLIINNEQ